ncbi:MAG: ferrous iron transport protein B [Rikenellaceae bacterium]|nr:ferrous iron transport protein B [Rikenellaceae bacterium]
MEGLHSRRLSELKNNEEAVILRVNGRGAFRKRITEMGFVRGKAVKVIKNAPLMDPVEYKILGYRIALRRSEAELIEVSTSADIVKRSKNSIAEVTFERESVNRYLHEEGKTINVALVGNPNSGKTSLFNVVSGSNERVGNYGGVTVDAKAAKFTHNGYRINIVDLPGTYSITEYTPEELFVRNHIITEMPDVVINVVDASNIERNLYLTTQLIDMNLKVVIALNLYDQLKSTGAELDYDSLGRMIGIPIIPTIASKNEGMEKLFDTVVDVYEDNEPIVRHIHINYGTDLENSINAIQSKIWENPGIVARYSTRYLAIKLLEGDTETLKLIADAANIKDIKSVVNKEINKLEKNYSERPETIIADEKYGFISGALEETYKPETKDKNFRTSKIDKYLTHKYLGIPIFLFMMWVMFQATFTLGEYPMEWIENGVEWLGEFVRDAMPDGSFRDLLVNGIISGVGGVIVFLPNILILFLFISIMEDTGYMARAAFIMDKLMHRIGLHGKSFIPLLMGFGCNVPAIMATHTLESRKDRVLTMLIMPFISCSARLPVYVLLISAFFSKNQGLIMFSIYLFGILVAIISSIVIKRIFFPKEEAPFVMELPPYRIPTTRNVLRHMWGKGVQYLKKMGTVILAASIIIWALGYFPRDKKIDIDYDQQRTEIMASNISPEEKKEELRDIDIAEATDGQANSYIGRIGHFIEPVIRPLGFDWKIGVSLVTGFAGKEVVVSTMAVLTNSDEEDESGFISNLQNQTYTSGPKTGEKVFNPLVAYTMMVFILLYFPCIAVIAAIRREAGRKWAWFTVFYTTGLAWLLSFAVYQIGSLF